MAPYYGPPIQYAWHSRPKAWSFYFNILVIPYWRTKRSGSSYSGKLGNLFGQQPHGKFIYWFHDEIRHQMYCILCSTFPTFHVSISIYSCLFLRNIKILPWLLTRSINYCSFCDMSQFAGCLVTHWKGMFNWTVFHRNGSCKPLKISNSKVQLEMEEFSTIFAQLNLKSLRTKNIHYILYVETRSI